MAKEFSLMLQWSSMSELDRVNFLTNRENLSFQILVLASQDVSLSVRTALLTLFEEIVNEDISWLSLLRRMSQNDPSITLRQTAKRLLKLYSGAS